MQHDLRLSWGCAHGSYCLNIEQKWIIRELFELADAYRYTEENGTEKGGKHMINYRRIFKEILHNKNQHDLRLSWGCVHGPYCLNIEQVGLTWALLSVAKKCISVIANEWKEAFFWPIAVCHLVSNSQRRMRTEKRAAKGCATDKRVQMAKTGNDHFLAYISLWW
jgi:hypothetical protein